MSATSQNNAFYTSRYDKVSALLVLWVNFYSFKKNEKKNSI